MPTLQLITKESRQVWMSPDGQRKIYELTMDYQGKPVSAKTYSDAIATVGWSGLAESYEKTGRNGVETFVKQPAKEGFSGSSSGGGKPAYQPKDEAAIKAMWAIDKAKDIVLGTMQEQMDEPHILATTEVYARELFAMVDRVKLGEVETNEVVGTTADLPTSFNQVGQVDTVYDDQQPLDLSEIDKVMGPTVPVKEDPWNSPS